MIKAFMELLLYVALVRGRKERVRVLLRGRLSRYDALPTREDLDVELEVARALERVERWTRASAILAKGVSR